MLVIDPRVSLGLAPYRVHVTWVLVDVLRGVLYIIKMSLILAFNKVEHEKLVLGPSTQLLRLWFLMVGCYLVGQNHAGRLPLG